MNRIGSVARTPETVTHPAESAALRPTTGLITNSSVPFKTVVPIAAEAK